MPTVSQSGSVTYGHLAVFTGNAVIADGGTFAVLSTSSTTLTIATGSITLTVAPKIYSFVQGASVIISQTATPTTNWMAGVVTSYNLSTGVMVVNVSMAVGSGTYSSWQVGLCDLQTLALILAILATGGTTSGLALDASVQATTAAILASALTPPIAVIPQNAVATLTDWSNAQPTLSGTSPQALLQTIAANANRNGFTVQNQSAGLLYLVLAGTLGNNSQSILLVGATGSNAQGSGISLEALGLKFTGVIKVYGPTGAQFAAMEY